MSLEVEHAGHKITYSENESRWRCWDLDIDAPQLAAVKAKITAFYAAERKLVPTEAIYWREYSSPEIMSVVMIAGDKKRASYENSSRSVWAVKADGSRGKYTADDLKVLDDDARAKMAEHKKLAAQVSALQKQLAAIRKSLKPLDVATLPRQDQQP